MAGTKDKLTGKAKQLEGKLTGDKTREQQGQEQKNRGRLKARQGELLEEDRENLGRMKEGAKDLGNRVKRAGRELKD